jgi:cell pole-organizing protein PopZ
MNKPVKGQEPSMEEILSSIRRIIADDDAAKAQATGTSRPAPSLPPRPAPPPPRPVADSPPPSAATLPPVFESGLGHEREPVHPSHEDEEMVAPLHLPPEKDVGRRGQPEILDLTEDMAAPEPTPPPPTRTPMPVAPPSAVHAEPPPPPPPPQMGPPLTLPMRDNPGKAAAEPPVPRTVEEARRQFAQVTAADRPLLSAGTTGAVDSAFNALAQSVLVQNSRTLEDLVREMLRPMLKAWLDDNLPALVERLVRAEIERVSRGGRGS